MLRTVSTQSHDYRADVRVIRTQGHLLFSLAAPHDVRQEATVASAEWIRPIGLLVDHTAGPEELDHFAHITVTSPLKQVQCLLSVPTAHQEEHHLQEVLYSLDS